VVKISYRGKVVLLGAPSVGKTSLLARYVDDKFSPVYHQTVGANFLIKEVDLKNVIDNLNVKNPNLTNDIKEKGFKLYFWDIGGQEQNLFANEYYFVQAVGAMVVFSLNDVATFKQVDFWIQKLRELSGEVPYIVIGNKSDLEKKVNSDEIEQLMNQYGVNYFETSAKLNKNVNASFEALSILILNNLK
jgi:small GTP-binding protein